MLDAIPLGRARGIVRHGEGEAEGVHELGLEFGFLRAASIAIASARISEQEQAAGSRVPTAAVELPPASNGARGKGRRVVRDADGHAPAIGEEIVRAMGNGHAIRLRAEVVIVARRAVIHEWPKGVDTTARSATNPGG